MMGRIRNVRSSSARESPRRTLAPPSGRSRTARRTRRGGVVVQVAVFSTVMLGMGALSVDVGAMYAARAELQSAVDAAALAAASNLAGEAGVDTRVAAREAATKYARLNRVLNTYGGVDVVRDIEFGSAAYDPHSGGFTFSPGTPSTDAVRVTVRRTDDSEGGPIPLGFANIFGFNRAELRARATAVLIPRDIAVVIDLSGSMSFDSQLYHYKQFTGEVGQVRNGVQVNLRDIWAALNGPIPDVPYVPGGENETQYATDTGPTFGYMTTWGNEVVPEVYNPVSDPGLWFMPSGSNTSNSTVNGLLLANAYTADEVSILMSGSRDSTRDVWRNRVGVMLGLATWRSGRPGGRSGGDGDAFVENGEITWVGYPSWAPGWRWTDYIAYVSSNSSRMHTANANLRYRFGLKTLTNWALESKPSNSQTKFAGTPQQPLQAVKDAVRAMTDVIKDLDSNDHLSLEIFATTTRHEIDLTGSLDQVPDRLYLRQASHYNGSTNIAGGIQAGIVELTGGRSRMAAHKVIVLMSDGKPNIDEDGNYVGNNSSTVYEWCRDRARAARDLGIRIYTVSVSSDADMDLMAQIAGIANGQHFHAEGTPEEYSDQLEDIFRTLGGKRPVVLIE
ncbi:MAG: VWA domain-containing protein [Phycisphaerales bacterium]|nr:VWA domain-containing protein [Phycisphaerales bacterium]